LFSAAKARCLLPIQFTSPLNRQIADFGEGYTTNYPQYAERDPALPDSRGTLYSLNWCDADEKDQSTKSLAKR
jgi:hypothetical protein